MEHLFISSLLLCITLLLSAVVVFRAWKKSKAKNSSPNLPPGPRKLPIIGNIHQLVGSIPHYRLRDLAKKYGPVMHLQLGETPHVIISSPEAAKEVMKTHDIIFAQRPSLVAASIIAYNCRDIAFAPYGEYWRQLRKFCILELLSAKRVQSFRRVREEEVSHLIRSISNSAGLPVNVSQMLLSSTTCIISRAAFGKLEKQYQDAFTALVHKALQTIGGFSIADTFPSIKLLHIISGVRTRIMKLYYKLDAIFEHIVNEHKARMTMENYNSDEEAYDLVYVLLNIMKREFPLSTDDIKAIILDMFIAGTETASTTMDWAMSELVKNPEVMKKVQAEVRQVFHGKENIDETSLHLLKYLNLVVKETFRLHPPGPLLLPRESRERAEINGYEIPAKTRVMVNIWAIQRDPKNWTEPEKFYPERFIDSPIDYKGTDFELIPFGAGRRMCPGMLFGIANVELTLANLLYHFDWKLPNGMKPGNLDMTEVFATVTRRKNALYLIPVPYVAS